MTEDQQPINTEQHMTAVRAYLDQLQDDHAERWKDWSSPVMTTDSQVVAKADPPPSVRGYSELLRLSVALDLDAVLAAWLCLRDHDADGRGLLRPSDARVVLEDVYRLGSRRTVYRLLAAGQDVFWTWTDDWLVLRSMDRVADELIARADDSQLTDRQFGPSPAGRAVDIPRDVLAVPGQRGHSAKSARRRAFFAVWVGCYRERGLTASLATLSRLWNVSERTVRTWTSSSDVQKKKNWRLDLDVQEPPAHHQPITTTDGSGSYWQLPNTYTAAPPTCARGMAYQLRRRMEHRRRRPVEQTADGQRLQLRFYRVFWNSLDAVQRAANALAKKAQTAGQDWTERPVLVPVAVLVQRAEEPPTLWSGRFWQVVQA